MTLLLVLIACTFLGSVNSAYSAYPLTEIEEKVMRAGQAHLVHLQSISGFLTHAPKNAENRLVLFTLQNQAKQILFERTIYDSCQSIDRNYRIWPRLSLGFAKRRERYNQQKL